MIDNRLGYWMLTFVCCLEPLIAIVAGILIHRRYLRHGLAGFMPGRRREGMQ